MSQCLIFCRTNVDCDNLEHFLNLTDGTKHKFSGKLESGKEGRKVALIAAAVVAAAIVTHCHN